MKLYYTFIVIFLFQHTSFSQLAQDYFPAQTGFKWTYRVTPLDSLNNPNSSLSFYQIDSLTVSQDYQGRSADYIVSKSGSELTVQFTPYLDTSYLSFQGNDAYKYYRLFNFDSFLGGMGNRKVNSPQTFTPDANQAFEGWFAYYKFAQTVNSNYSIFSKDTSIIIDSVSFPVRYEVKGKRLADQTISTEMGDFDCKKFLLTTVVSYLPLPFLPIPIYQLIDTSWIAPGNWIVKQVLPSSEINLSVIGLTTFYLPGSVREIIPALITDIESEYFPPQDFYLYQNFPNPFNPTTKIRYNVPANGKCEKSAVILRVYDLLGNEVATLVDEYKAAGSYEVEFESTSSIRNLASGIYFYQLKVNDFVKTRKMILIK